MVSAFGETSPPNYSVAGTEYKGFDERSSGWFHATEGFHRPCVTPPASAEPQRGRVDPMSDRQSSTFKTAMKASCGISTLPMDFMRFLPSFCFSSSFRLRVMSPP